MAEEKEKIPVEEVKFLPNGNEEATALDVEKGKKSKDPGAFVGLTKDELMQYADDPFWVSRGPCLPKTAQAFVPYYQTCHMCRNPTLSISLGAHAQDPLHLVLDFVGGHGGGRRHHHRPLAQMSRSSGSKVVGNGRPLPRRRPHLQGFRW